MKYLKRFKNRVVILAIAANIVSILLLLGIIDIVQSETINKVIGLIVQVLVLGGIVHNPDPKNNPELKEI